MKKEDAYKNEEKNLHLLKGCRRVAIHKGKVLYADNSGNLFELYKGHRCYLEVAYTTTDVLQNWKDGIDSTDGDPKT